MSMRTNFGEKYRLLQELKEKEATRDRHQAEYTRVLARLASLEVSPATRAVAERYLKGEITLQELDAAIDRHLRTT